MGIIGTAVAVSLGTRNASGAASRKETRRAIERHNGLRPVLAWFDALSDADAWQYASTVLGTSRGSRYADRAAVIAHLTAQAF